jgi:hypothetical protein
MRQDSQDGRPLRPRKCLEPETNLGGHHRETTENSQVKQVQHVTRSEVLHAASCRSRLARAVGNLFSRPQCSPPAPVPPAARSIAADRGWRGCCHITVCIIDSRDDDIFETILAVVMAGLRQQAARPWSCHAGAASGDSPLR